MIDPLPQWVEYGEFSIQLRFHDESYTNDIFYFCHVRLMSTTEREHVNGMHTHYWHLLRLDSSIHVWQNQAFEKGSAHYK